MVCSLDYCCSQPVCNGFISAWADVTFILLFGAKSAQGFFWPNDIIIYLRIHMSPPNYGIPVTSPCLPNFLKKNSCIVSFIAEVHMLCGVVCKAQLWHIPFLEEFLRTAVVQVLYSLVCHHCKWLLSFLPFVFATFQGSLNIFLKNKTTIVNVVCDDTRRHASKG